MAKENWKHIDIPFNQGFGLQEYSPMGFVTIKNLIYDESGNLRTRPSRIETSNPSTSSAIYDIYVQSSQFKAFCVSNTKLYYAAYFGLPWNACSYTGNITRHGTWAEISGHLIFCPSTGGTGTGNPVICDLATPTFWSDVPLTAGTWSNGMKTCIIYKNCLMVSNDNTIYYSQPGNYVLHATERYLKIGYDSDPIIRMINLNGTLVIIKGRSLHVRRINNADFAGNQFEEIISNTTLLYNSYPQGAANDITSLNMVTPSGILSYSGGLRNLVKGWSDNYMNTQPYKYNAKLYYWTAMNYLMLYDETSNNVMIFDLKRNVWIRWEISPGIRSIYSMEGTSSAELIYTGHSDGKIYYWAPYYPVGETGYEATVNQEVLTPYLTFGDNPTERDAKKWVKRLYIQGKGWSTVELYARNKESESFTKIFPATGYGTYTENDVVIPIPADAGQYRQHYIKLAGTGQCVLRSLAVDVEFGRLHND